ncbi:MAG: filamentous hemagglutinin N-terminal domain-containing protein, partial [Terrimicrobiaceae bacterium]|nr:filamentous hemagglutinin N-terminal domain-containing protein [Terrimicrobiaceae bacterium]
MIDLGFSGLFRAASAVGLGAVSLQLAASPAEAGDILRGGAVMSSSARRSQPSSAGAGADVAARTQANAGDRLARTSKALDAVRAMQIAARAAVFHSRNLGRDPAHPNSRLPDVTDGLSANGLKLAAGVPKNLAKPKPGENPASWIGAGLPRQTIGKGGVNVTIVQNDQQALLTWAKFNIGKKTTLTFDQSAGGSDRGKWVAFNKVSDPSGRPSQILGSIKADGQVYVINQNGIIFGGASQVNVHTLVASALPINDSLVANGLLNNTSAQFLFSALATDSFDSSAAVKTLSQIADPRGTLQLAFTDNGGKIQTFVPGVDFTVSVDADRRSAITFTDAGLIKLTSVVKPNTTLTANYVALNGDVTVQAGAQVTIPTSAAKVGGRAMLVGANVTNDGAISTPDGQTILAAGLQVGIAAHSKDDPSLRGLDIFVGAVADPASKRVPHAGTAINAGLIDAPRANVTIAGKSVQQNGFIESSTTVSLNGRIDLDANYDAVANPAFNANGATDAFKTLFVRKSTGIVTFGEGSVTRILPELLSDEQVTGDEVAIRSQINVRGLAVHFAKGSSLLAPNAKVSVNAGGWNFIPGNGANSPPTSQFVHAAGQIYLDDGVLLDVAGTTNVAVPQSDNILTLQLRGSELADSPLQRDGPFRGTTITIDARETGTFNGREWIGTPLGDATGFLGLVQHGVGPLTTKGGSVDLQAGDSVVVSRGAVIDVSGGWQQNEGGLVQTTKVVQGSRLIDIADATPDQVYDGIYDPKFTQTHTKWGIAHTFRNPLDLNGAHLESSYIQGAAGGAITIAAPSMALDGTLVGATVAGPKQVRQNASTSSLPDAGKLALVFKSQDPSPIYGLPFSDTSLHPPKVVFSDAVQAQALPFALDADGNPLALEGDGTSGLVNPFQLRTKRRDLLVLSPALLTEQGFGDLTVDNGAGDISVPAGIALTAPAGGAITFNGRNIDIQGGITAPGGSLSFTANNLSPYFVAQFKTRDTTKPFQPVFADPSAGRFTLGSTGVLSTAGLVIDERNASSDEPLSAIVTAGGKIDIAAYTANLAVGSLVDVSGGVFVDPLAKVTYGDAGAIGIRAGKDPNLAALFPAPPKGATLSDRLLGGRLRLRGELRGYSGGKGGSLALQAPFIQVGGVRSASSAPGTLFLRPEFFDQGGFSSFDLAGIGGARSTVLGAMENLPGLVIAADTLIAPQTRSLFADTRTANGANLTIARTVKPLAERMPVSLAFQSLGMSDEAQNIVGNVGIVFRGDLVVQDGAVIRTDPQATVSFKADTVAILGGVSAPAGVITIEGGTDSAKVFKQDAANAVAMPTVYLGSKSRLSAAGTTVLAPDPFGRRAGTVLPGGSIGVAGNIVAAGGAVLDVSGASSVLDFSPLVLDAAASRVISVRSGLTRPLQALQTVPVRVDSDGGAIALDGGEMLFTDATLRGRAGGPTALGGALDVSSGRFSIVGALPTESNLIVTQSDRTIPVAPLPSIFQPGEQTAIGRPVVNRDGVGVPALGYFAADKFLDGGFDSLALGGVVRFKGPVAIDARGSLKVADGGVLYADDAVDLTAPYVALGQPFKTPPLPGVVDQPFGSSSLPLNFGPTHGPGVLTVQADLIDIGNLSLRNMRFANFIARDGDIRGSGTLNIAGRLRFEAGQIYTPSALSFTAVAYDYKAGDFKPGDALKPGSVVIKASGARQLPLSAGGTLSFYASDITQAGVLRAPLGTINLGWDGTGAAPVDLITGTKRAFPITKKLVLGSQSITSVSAVDPTTGAGILIPYGLSLDGNSWIDPRGVDVTSGGLPAGEIHLAASKIVTKATSQIELRGGGDLYAYRWVGGLGGSQDILASDSSFAVLPGYQANFAPIAGFNSADTVTAFNRDPNDAATRDAGYVNPALSIGDRVQLGASDGLPAGAYTLLPARYALLPGAFLVTPKAGSAIGALAQPDGATLVSGYRFNGLDPSRAAPSVFSRFEVASGDVVRNRAQYDSFNANRFLRDSALAAGIQPQPLPIDSGHLVFQATDAMRLNGVVRGQAPFGGRGAFIDVSSPADIIIAGDDANLSKRQTNDAIVLKSSLLSSWGAESLLIGGVRTVTEEGTTVAVATGNLTVDNAGSPLAGPEIILVADQTLTLAPGADVAQSGDLTGHADSLLLDGDGTLLRVSSDPLAKFTRTNVTTSHAPKMK